MLIHGLIVPQPFLPVRSEKSIGHGKITNCMPEAAFEEKINPPRMIPSLVEGFNIITQRVFIILFPVGMDLLFWYGPLVRVKDLLLPIINEATEVSATAYGAEGQAIVAASIEMWTSLLERLNMLFVLRTFPVGVPSLMISQGSIGNPLGNPRIFEISSFHNAFGMMALLWIAGIFLGSMYYEVVTCGVMHCKEAIRFRNLIPAVGQSVLLSVILFLAVILLGVPLIFLISAATLFFPTLGMLPFTIAGILLIWTLLPLVFSPHGIFSQQMRAPQSMAASVRLVRPLMTHVGVFLILIIVLSYGLDSLWSTPPAESWMLLVGILGHGFISSGLLAASFVYYRDGVSWFNKQLRERENPVQPVISSQ